MIDRDTADTSSAVSNLDRKTATAAAFTGLLAYAVTLSVGPASINAIGESFRVRSSQLSALFFLHAVGFFFAIAAGAFIARRFTKQTAVVVGCVLMTAGCFLFGLAPGYLLALPAMFLIGWGGGFAEPMAMALVSDVYTGRKRTSMMNYAQVAFGAGAVGFPLLVGWALARNIDWRISFFGAAGACLIASVIGSYRMSKIPSQVQAVEKKAIHLRDPLLFMLAAGMFLYVGAELGTANWLARFFAEELSANRVLAAGTVSIFWGGITVGRFLTGVIAKHFRDVTIIRASLILALIGQFGVLFSHTPLSAAVFVGLLGLCMASVWPTILAHAGEVFSHQLESAFTVIVGAGCFGAIFIPPAIGAVSDFAGWRMALAICPLLGIINITIFTMISRRERKR